MIQTSAMDCGPAALTTLLRGFGVDANYERLREACHTDVDGTSIDSVEDLAVTLGLDAEQLMLPPDHLLEPAAGALPAIVVVRLPNGFPHFLVAWRRHRRLVQLMDPAAGRRWITARRLQRELYIHEQRVPADAFREWAGSDDFTRVLRQFLSRLGVDATTYIDRALLDPTWRGVASLDAATRMTTALMSAGAVSRGPEATGALGRLLEEPELIPAAFWTARVIDDGTAEDDLVLRGAVLVRTRGVTAADAGALSPELAATLEQPPVRPFRELAGLVRHDGLVRPALLATALIVAAAGVVIEGLAFRGLFSLSRDARADIAAVAPLLVVLAGLALLEWPAIAGLLRLGRVIEISLRRTFLGRLPRLPDRYLATRPSSDMAQRAHLVHRLHQVPGLAGDLLRALFELLITAGAIVWLVPPTAGVVLVGVLVSLAIPLALRAQLDERDHTARVHDGALGRFQLDALLGLVAIRAHRGESAVRAEHRSITEEWRRAAVSLVRWGVGAEALQAAAGFVVVGAVIAVGLPRTEATADALLLIFWAFSVPAAGAELGALARMYPPLRSITLRLLEPLRAPVEDMEPAAGDAGKTSPGGVEIELVGVGVAAADRAVLDDVTVHLRSGEHVAIVGRSGAGKSTLVGLLLGWQRATSGEVCVDGAPLDARSLTRLRAATAWVDPAVHLWNRSLRDNLRRGEPPEHFSEVLAEAGLDPVIAALPEGLDTHLGEGGGLLSGGEGQRVRYARAALRPGVRLALLDEPFRGLDRAERASLLAAARRRWSSATLLCVTHDVEETLTFDRVIVLEDGAIVEDGVPAQLASDPQSRFNALLAAERDVARLLWEGEGWRRLRLEDGRLLEEHAHRGEIPALPATVLPTSAAAGDSPPDPLFWPSQRRADATFALAVEAGLVEPRAVPTSFAGSASEEQVEHAAAYLALECEPASVSHSGWAGFLQGSSPCLLGLEEGWVVGVVEADETWAKVVTPQGVVRVRVDDLRDRAWRERASKAKASAEALVAAAGVGAARAPTAVGRVVGVELAATRIDSAWTLRPSRATSLRRQLARAHVGRRAAAAAALHAAEYGLFLAVWGVAGTAALRGQATVADLMTGAALAAVLVSVSAAATARSGVLAVDIGRVLKDHLLEGSLRLRPAEVRRRGIGAFLGSVLEAERISEGTVTAATIGLVAVAEIIAAAAALAFGVAPAPLLVLLVLWLGLTGLGGAQVLRRERRWAETRLTMTARLVEYLVGHRTRAIEEGTLPLSQEIQELGTYADVSRRLDRAKATLRGVVPRSWLLAAAAVAVPFMAQQPSQAALAATLGGVLLASRGLRRLAGAVAEAIGISVSWQHVRDVATAAARVAEPVGPPAVGGPGVPVLEARAVNFAYAADRPSVLAGVDLTVSPGDRLLCSGRSGGGKSTLVSVLGGLHLPDEGELWLRGAERREVGAWAWRGAVVVAPQFGDNHVLSASVGFNLLLGRRWPPRNRDLDVLDEVCAAVGLDEVIARMPAGLDQPAGETGWQLSHGERSRLFAARALLQGAEVVVLDESFAALDPETLAMTLEAVLRQAPTLMVVAHR